MTTRTHDFAHRPDADADVGEKPFAPSCERNRDSILDVLRGAFVTRRRVLEVGSGTGQHAVHFAAAMPWLRWQCSDRAEHLPGMRRWLDEAALPNTPPPVALDVFDATWPVASIDDGGPDVDRAAAPRVDAAGVDAACFDAAGFDAAGFDAAFTANTLHIMAWEGVQACFAGLDRVLAADATLVVYGPFNRDGAFDGDSNRQFDVWLKARDPRSGLRDLDAVDALARGIGLGLVDDLTMPANNRCLVWRRGGDTSTEAS